MTPFKTNQQIDIERKEKEALSLYDDMELIGLWPCTASRTQFSYAHRTHCLRQGHGLLKKASSSLHPFLCALASPSLSLSEPIVFHKAPSSVASDPPRSIQSFFWARESKRRLFSMRVPSSRCSRTLLSCSNCRLRMHTIQ